MIEEEDIILATSDVSALIPEGTRGQVHQVYVSHPRSYLVEFMDEEDTPIDTVEVDEGCIELESKTGGKVYLNVARRP